MYRFAGVAASILVATGLAIAPLAHADPDSTQEFLDQMHAAGFSGVGSDSFLVINAWQVCRALDQGAPPADVAATLAEDRPDLMPEDVGTVVVLAIRYFCPVHLPAAAAPAESAGETTA